MDGLDIKYEDSEIILVIKPAGVATESRRIGEKDMLSMVKTYRVERGESNYVAMLHRLDQPVGGLLLFAKTKEAAAKLSKQIQNGTVEKYYKALLCGRIEEEGELTDYLLRDGKTNISRVVGKETPGAKKASLMFRRLKVFSREPDALFEKGSFPQENSQSGKENTSEKNQISLVEIKLATGRHHQIRVQMANHGFPLLGDRKYAVLKRCDVQLALFAWRLKFRHPKTGKWMDFTEEPSWKLE